MANKKVYVVGPSGGPYKVGISGDVEFRVKELQIGNWHDLGLIFCFDGDAALELKLHKMFQSKRIRGEWFQLDDTDLTKILNVIPSRNIYFGTQELQSLALETQPHLLKKVATNYIRQNGVR